MPPMIVAPERDVPGIGPAHRVDAIDSHGRR
jgi:hypothetical protein